MSLFSGYGMVSEGAESEAMVATLENGEGFICLVCNKISSVKGNLKKHVESMHIKEVPVDCKFCRKPFKNKNSLQNHVSLNHRDMYNKNDAF